jgi:hypothetical protein
MQSVSVQRKRGFMRKLTVLLATLLLVTSGCVISPRRTVNGSGGSGGSNSEFSLSVNPTSQAIAAGASAVYTVTVQAVNGFTGTVSLSASSSISGIVASFDNTTITGGSGSATLTVQTSATSTGTATITVFASDTANNVSQSLSLTATVQAASKAGAVISAASATVPSGCVNSLAGSGIQRVSLPSTPSAQGFTATFDATPSSSAMDASLGFFAAAPSAHPTLNEFVRFTPAGFIQASDGDMLATSNVPYSAGVTYHFRLVGNLPAATYSLFVAPQGATEIPLGTNLQVPAGQRGATTLTGWGLLINGPDGDTFSVCNFDLR